ncbi:glycerol-3-phosphate 1-O-acyltransferase PlsB [Chromohalobacter japonicus]|uniref:glycerol-3-phosphate 1-O-acyltransferase PlsB n=1 Tax=Chromohalobacter japonicus TaxID=223900 RepID=UPI003F8EC624
MAVLRTLLAPLRALCRTLLEHWLDYRHVEAQQPVLDAKQPTLYVLPHPAFSDRLALELITRREGLPSARGSVALGETRLPACIALPRLSRGLTQVHGRRSPHLDTLLAQLADDPGQDIQLVPVSVFWGRAPGKDFGFWKLLAADSWQWSGRLRRLLSMAVNGKHVQIHIGAPLQLHTLVETRSLAVAQRKTARVLRVHFRRVRARVLGPDLSHRNTLIRGVVDSPQVRQAISDAATARGTSPERETRRALRYGREIASNTSYPVLRFLYQLLRRLWNRLYDGVTVNGLDDVKALAGDHELIYVPCHRSHIDYLLLSYALFREGLMPPHIAAGRNLDMPVIGGLLRRGGAFFLRRSFRDNRLYAAVFNEYVHRLISRGHPLEYFIEGGRSRTGRMLAPRPGMLAMTLRSFARDPRREVAFVPVYVGYEKVLESGSYLKELRGGHKKKESPFDLLRIVRRLRQPYGHVTVNVGEPLMLSGFLDRQVPDWRDNRRQTRPDWLNQAVPALGASLGQRINAAAAITPVSLVALGLLANSHHAIEADLLERHMRLLVDLRQHLPGGERITLPEGEPRDWIAHTAQLEFIERRQQALGELVLATPEQATLLTWYRNNVLHLYIDMALVAFAYRHNARFNTEELLTLLGPAWPVLAHEFHLPVDAFSTRLERALAALASEDLLIETDHGWERPAGHLASSEHLRLLGRLVQPTLERGYLLLAVLLREGSGTLTREALEEQSRQLAERLTLLSGLNAPEFFDKRLFSGLLDTLESQGWLWQENDKLCYDSSLENAQRRGQALFDPSLHHRLTQLVHRRSS